MQPKSVMNPPRPGGKPGFPRPEEKQSPRRTGRPGKIVPACRLAELRAAWRDAGICGPRRSQNYPIAQVWSALRPGFLVGGQDCGRWSRPANRPGRQLSQVKDINSMLWVLTRRNNEPDDTLLGLAIYHNHSSSW